ncbi:MAG: AraC family transcriptional regulator, partial [Pseudomonadota bacterium]
MLQHAHEISNDPHISDDYARVARTIEFLAANYRDQPELEQIASAVGEAPVALQRLFKRWSGLTPKAFLQAITLDAARGLLADEASILDAAYEVGYSGPGRLHDLFVTHEAMSPGEWKQRGAGVTIRYGFHPSPFGNALVMITERGLCGLAFAEDGEETAAFEDMT